MHKKYNTTSKLHCNVFQRKSNKNYSFIFMGNCTKGYYCHHHFIIKKYEREREREIMYVYINKMHGMNDEFHG